MKALLAMSMDYIARAHSGRALQMAGFYEGLRNELIPWRLVALRAIKVSAGGLVLRLYLLGIAQSQAVPDLGLTESHHPPHLTTQS